METPFVRQVIGGLSNEALGTRALQVTDLTEIHLFKASYCQTHTSSFKWNLLRIRSHLLIRRRYDVGVI